MQKKTLLTITLLSYSILFYAQTNPKDTEVWEPEPKVVTSGNHGAPPSDAIILFDGSNLDQWVSAYGEGNAKWKIEKLCVNKANCTQKICKRFARESSIIDILDSKFLPRCLAHAICRQLMLFTARIVREKKLPLQISKKTAFFPVKIASSFVV